ncbi:1-acyl-sn-glycerol-3-phosphate acyltransferase [Capilliphycus salinus ALCB114379]|uniref:1-acyl-sn-glycerol-3-phosphate acyltransferase n=1 Tax=Capilliphycus salinus TaxID=2768948 RepID=UPI0039A58D55
MPNLMTNVQPPLQFLPPDFQPGVLKFTQWIVPWWIRLKTPITQIDAENVEQLVELYQKFQQEKIRFLLAFRHPNPDDPLPISQLIWRKVPGQARKQNITLKSPVHAHFMYDRGIPLWAGNYVTWLFPKLGGTSILRGKLDRKGLKSARNLFANGRFPMAAAPEGATNGLNYQVSPLEPGIAQLGFWCVEDLEKAQRCEDVFIVPLGIQYHYLQENWQALAQVLGQIETDCGLTNNNSQPTPSALYPRLVNLGNYLLDLMENFYRQYYHQPIPKNTNEELPIRLQRLLDIALQVAESYFAIQPKGSLTERCRRLEQTGWDYIYREDIKDAESLSPVERGLANRIAEEASLRMWHMRLVESFVAVSGKYVQENPTFDRFAQITIIIWTMIMRLKGGNPNRTPYLGKQRVEITVGEPISVSQRWSDYKTNRRQAVENLTQQLQSSLEKMSQPQSKPDK